eukprot:COSAG05_NODE_298_length_11929_cov_43.811496_3_plen_251_part_00
MQGDIRVVPRAQLLAMLGRNDRGTLGLEEGRSAAEQDGAAAQQDNKRHKTLDYQDSRGRKAPVANATQPLIGMAQPAPSRGGPFLGRPADSFTNLDLDAALADVDLPTDMGGHDSTGAGSKTEAAPTACEAATIQQPSAQRPAPHTRYHQSEAAHAVRSTREAPTTTVTQFSSKDFETEVFNAVAKATQPVAIKPSSGSHVTAVIEGIADQWSSAREEREPSNPAISISSEQLGSLAKGFLVSQGSPRKM